MSVLYTNVRFVLFAKTSNVHFEVYHIQLYLHRGSILLPPATKLGQGYVFTGVCHSVNGGGT